ncbi:MAG: sterol desaturase family protein [Steroidobacteraceae bacterium]
MRPGDHWTDSAVWAALGLALWSLLEYGLHRYVLHGLRPFSTWHAEHHRCPAARIYSPTLLSVALIGALVYLPLWLLLGAWPACAIAFGVLSGYFAYSVTHHALHHRGVADRWLGRRRHWHLRHHARPNDPMARPGYYGVTSAVWDHVFRSDRKPSGRRTVVAPET